MLVIFQKQSGEMGAKLEKGKHHLRKHPTEVGLLHENWLLSH